MFISFPNTQPTAILHLVYALSCFAKVPFDLHDQYLHYCITFLPPAYSYLDLHTQNPSLGPSSEKCPELLLKRLNALLSYSSITVLNASGSFLRQLRG